MKLILSILYLIAFIVLFKVTDWGNQHIFLAIIGGLGIIFLLGNVGYQIDKAIQRRKGIWYSNYQSRLIIEKKELYNKKQSLISIKDTSKNSYHKFKLDKSIYKIDKKIQSIDNKLKA